MKHDYMRPGTPNSALVTHPLRVSRHAVWRDCVLHVSYDFFDATVYISSVTSCGVTQLLVVSRGLARPK
jgi:hypothetical protein